MSKRDELRYREPVDGYRILVTPDERDDLLAVVDAAEKVLPPTPQMGCKCHMCALAAAVARVTEASKVGGADGERASAGSDHRTSTPGNVTEGGQT